MTRTARVAALLFLSSVAFQTLFIRLDAFPSDEGLALLAAADVADGGKLYRDIYVPLTPLSYLVQGAVFKLFGSGLLPSRALVATLYAGSVAMIFAMAAACLPFGFAVLAGVLAIPLQLWVWPHAQFYSYTPLAVFFALASVCVAWAIDVNPRRKLLSIGLGAGLGLATWAKPNIGVMTGIGIALYWLIGLARRGAGTSPGPRRRSVTDVLRDGGCVVLGAIAVSVPIVGQLLTNGTLDRMLESIARLAAIYSDVPPDIFPAFVPPTGKIESLQLNQDLIVPGMLASSLRWDEGYRYLLAYTTWIDTLVRLVYHPLVVIQFAIAAHLALRIRRKAWTREDDAVLLLLCVTSCLWLTIVPHAAVHYLMPAQLPGIVLACVLLARGWNLRQSWLRYAIRSAGIAGCALYAILSAGMLWFYLSAPRASVQTNKGMIWMNPIDADALTQVLDYAKQHIAPDQAVFTYPYFPLFHFLSDVPHATRFVDLRPGSPGTAAEDEIIRQLEVDRIELVIGFTGSQYPGIESFAAAYPRLDHYLRAHYPLDRTISTYFGTFAEVRRRR